MTPLYSRGDARMPTAVETNSIIHSTLRSTTGAGVWERVWRHVPDEQKDDALLDRERRSPRWLAIVQHLSSSLGNIGGIRTIELGSGRGDLSVLLAQHGAHVTLADYSPTALELARSRFERLGLAAEYVTVDICSEPHRLSESFDVALSSGVIEHFRGHQRTRVIHAHYDVLRPGGMAVISVPHAWCVPYRLWKAYLELRGWWPYGMELPYGRREIAGRARRAGFERAVTECTGFWQSIGDQWGRNLLGRGPDWVTRRSALDPLMGLNLLLFAWRAGRWERERLRLSVWP